MYSETEKWRSDGDFTNFTAISEEEKAQLLVRFQEQEVYSRLKMCVMDKSLGLDGFTMGFFIKCWEILKKDIMEAFHNFYEQEMFEKSFNATYIALIPKKNEPKN